MYNLSLPKLCATLLLGAYRGVLTKNDCSTLYCAVPYIVACVDVSRTVFRDRSSSSFSPDLFNPHLCHPTSNSWQAGCWPSTKRFSCYFWQLGCSSNVGAFRKVLEANYAKIYQRNFFITFSIKSTYSRMWRGISASVQRIYRRFLKFAYIDVCVCVWGKSTHFWWEGYPEDTNSFCFWHNPVGCFITTTNN